MATPNLCIIQVSVYSITGLRGRLLLEEKNLLVTPLCALGVFREPQLDPNMRDWPQSACPALSRRGLFEFLGVNVEFEHGRC